MQKRTSIHALLVEDDPIDQMAIQKANFNKDINAFITYENAGSLKEAQDKIENNIYDIIVCDYHLGDGSAFSILENRPDIPIIIVTGVGDEEIAVKAMHLGANDYLVKDGQRNYLKLLPISIVNTINHHLAIREAEDAKAAEEE